MAKLNIIIRGIALSYHKGDGIWKILFPFDENHQIRFKGSPSDAGISLAQANRNIKITAENPVSTFEIGSDYENFLDLTADYSHKNGVVLKPDWRNKAVLMTIANAKLSVDEYTEKEHMLIKDGLITLEPTLIAYSGVAQIIGEKIIVEVSNHPDFPKVFENDQTLIFDNDCAHGADRIGSDFDLVYQILRDKQEAEQQFTVCKVPDNTNSIFSIGVNVNINNVDPFTDLPCHKVRISKSENLV
jgi:hypothetical protein